MGVILWATHLNSVATTHFELEPGFYQLGRSTPHDPPEKLSIPFDPKLSRRTARLEVKRSCILVCRDGSRSPIFVEQEERERFELLPGGRFCVAETVFELLSEAAQTVADEELNQARRSPAEQVVALMLEVQSVLEENLPIPELLRRLNRVLAGSRVALIADSLPPSGEAQLVPSRSLVAQALQQQAPVFYEWAGAGGEQPTAAQNESWALAVPIRAGLMLYAVGHHRADPLQRGGYCLLAQMLGDYLEARKVVNLQASLHVKSLGEFEARMGGTRLDQEWGGKQLSWLLSFFASTSRSVTEDRLMQAFWPDKGGRARRNLMVALSKLRGHLREGGFDSDPLPRNHTGYKLDDSLNYWHDYTEVQSLIAQIDTATASELVLSAAERLVQLNRGPYLEGCYLDWAARRRTELEGQLQTAYQRAGRVALECQNHESALRLGQLGLERDPCCQESRLVCMMSLMSLGRPEQAVRHYEQCRKRLAEDLGMEPSLALEKACQRALLSLP